MKRCKYQIPNTEECGECKEGYYLMNRKCYSCDKSCLKCNNDKSCISCNNGYYRLENENSNTLCKLYSEFNNCESDNYMTNKGCIKCKEGYYKTDKYECQICNLTNNKCNTCDDNK